MSHPSFDKMDPPSVKSYLEAATPEELERSISTMSAEQIRAALQHIDTLSSPTWENFTRAAILGLNNRPQLEAAARGLSCRQILILIDKTLQIEDKHHWKLSPILVGIAFEVFSELLVSASLQQLQVLQHEGVTEPVQHQLTTLSHELTNQIELIGEEIDSIDDEIALLDMTEVSREDALEIEHRIGLYIALFEKIFNLSNRALSIAWNTNRVDLIESFNKIKDSCQKYTVYGIGSPRKEETPPSGLYRRLDDQLFSCFGDPENPDDREALKETEPAIEALAKFSVWYLRDYWELGLLPAIKRKEDLDLDLAHHSEIERAKYRENLFSQARTNLDKIGLSNVLDLKKAYIFSRKTLQEYIESKTTHCV